MSEKDWIDGNTAAWTAMLSHCLHQLGTASPSAARLTLEREQTVASLRRLCDAYGDNEWSAELHLSDIIEKHLIRPLLETGSQP